MKVDFVFADPSEVKGLVGCLHQEEFMVRIEKPILRFGWGQLIVTGKNDGSVVMNAYEVCLTAQQCQF